MSKPIVIILHRYSKIIIRDTEIGNHMKYSQIEVFPPDAEDQLILTLYSLIKQNVYN